MKAGKPGRIKSFERGNTIRQVIAALPEAEWVFEEYGLELHGEPAVLDETIEQVALAQGQSPADLVVELNGLWG